MFLVRMVEYVEDREEVLCGGNRVGEGRGGLCGGKWVKSGLGIERGSQLVLKSSLRMLKED